MFSEGLKYYRGSKDSYEAVEGDITRRDGTYITTCVINVDLLLCGLTAFPCGNGEDYPLTPEQQLKVLEFIRRERISRPYWKTAEPPYGKAVINLPMKRSWLRPPRL